MAEPSKQDERDIDRELKLIQLEREKLRLQREKAQNKLAGDVGNAARTYGKKALVWGAVIATCALLFAALNQAWYWLETRQTDNYEAAAKAYAENVCIEKFKPLAACSRESEIHAMVNEYEPWSCIGSRKMSSCESREMANYFLDDKHKPFFAERQHERALRWLN